MWRFRHIKLLFTIGVFPLCGLGKLGLICRGALVVRSDRQAFNPMLVRPTLTGASLLFRFSS